MHSVTVGPGIYIKSVTSMRSSMLKSGGQTLKFLKVVLVLPKHFYLWNSYEPINCNIPLPSLI